ncbi:MAG: GNAT family N-acetyltransferase [Candidatus Rokubacteria bacterium]|nr:GNAT family N-acetyltransferase [Candidatus Rokubacteria bacterium]
MRNPFLIGTKIYLRPLEREDAALFVPWINDAEVNRTLNRYRPMTLEAEEEFIQSLVKSEHDLALGIVARQTDRLIGATGLHRIDFRNHHAAFGIVIGDKNEWNKGYGTEATGLLVGYAFGTLNLNRVWLHVYENNPRAIHVYEKVGFKREGVLRQDRYQEGRYWDAITMGILREEWKP